MDGLDNFARILVALAAGYAMHSTVALAGWWILVTWTRPTQVCLVERGWKLAAVLGLATALGQQVAFVEVGEFAARDVAGGQQLTSDRGESHRPAGIVPAKPKRQHSQEIGAEAISPDTAPEPGRNDSSRSQVDRHGAAIQATEGLNEPGSTLGKLRSISAPIQPMALPAAHQTPRRSILQAVLSWEIRRESVRVICVLLAACMAGGLVRLLWQTITLHRRFMKSTELRRGMARRELDRFLKQFGIRRPIRLLTSQCQAEPITFGVLRWTIVLPE